MSSNYSYAAGTTNTYSENASWYEMVLVLTVVLLEKTWEFQSSISPSCVKTRLHRDKIEPTIIGCWALGKLGYLDRIFSCINTPLYGEKKYWSFEVSNIHNLFSIGLWMFDFCVPLTPYYTAHRNIEVSKFRSSNIASVFEVRYTRFVWPFGLLHIQWLSSVRSWGVVGCRLNILKLRVASCELRANTILTGVPCSTPTGVLM